MTSRVVFDCMVFLQGAGRPASPARACFRLVDEEQITLCLSREIVAEVRDVLTRSKVRHRFPLLTQAWVDEFLVTIESKSVFVPEVPHVFTLVRDPKDEPYVNLAVASQAQFLVSRDRDLLDLMNEPAFRRRFPNLQIVDPVAFLQAIARSTPTHPGPE